MRKRLGSVSRHGNTPFSRANPRDLFGCRAPAREHFNTYPSPQSLSGALFRLMQETLRKRGHTGDVTALYAEGFDPVLTPNEKTAYLEGPDLPRRGWC